MTGKSLSNHRTAALVCVRATMGYLNSWAIDAPLTRWWTRAVSLPDASRDPTEKV